MIWDCCWQKSVFWNGLLNIIWHSNQRNNQHNNQRNNPNKKIETVVRLKRVNPKPCLSTPTLRHSTFPRSVWSTCRTMSCWITSFHTLSMQITSFHTLSKRITSRMRFILWTYPMNRFPWIRRITPVFLLVSQMACTSPFIMRCSRGAPSCPSCNRMLHNATQHNAIQCNTTLHNAIQRYAIQSYYTIKNSALHCFLLHKIEI